MDDRSALIRACDLQPDEDMPRLALADQLDETEWAQRSTVLRAGCAIRRQVAGILPPDTFPAFQTQSEGWEAVGKELEAMAEHPEDTDAFRQRYERLVRGDVPLDPEHLEPTLRLQYDLQVSLLSSLNLLDEDDDGPFLTAIDGNRYPLPPFEQVLSRMQTPGMQTKLRQGFNTLLLVPFGLSLERLTDAWRQGLQRNASTLRSVGAFNKADPLWVWSRYRSEALVYDPKRFATDSGDKTKEEILAQNGRGWDVLLVEGALQNLPRGGQGHTVGGRPQIECGRTLEQYLRDLPAGEVGLTPEAYIIQFLDALERRGQVLDTETLSWLTDTFLPTSRDVPGASWYPVGGRAYLDGFHPDVHRARQGVRAAVRVG